jgi:hypothetical protein
VLVLALYTTGTEGEREKLVAVSANEEIVRAFAARVLEDHEQDEPEADPVSRELAEGRKRALRLVAGA